MTDMAPWHTRSTLLNRQQQLTLDESVMAEIEALRASGELGDGTRTEPRCHICCEVESKDLVNKLIAAGLTNREIVESCDSINARRRDASDERIIGARNVWQHRRLHFNVDKPANAVLREILERRAEETSRDHINGVGHAVTPYAVIESTMVRGYQERIANDQADPPSVKETIDAAKILHELTSKDAGTKRMADLLFKMDRIINAARMYVPADRQDEFLAMVEGRQTGAAPTPIDRVAESVHQDAEQVIREFSPPTHMDEEDEI